MADKNLKLAQKTVDMINEFGGCAQSSEVDITSEKACKQLAAHAMDTYGRIDILDNNVGIVHAGSVVDDDQERWENLMKVNVTAMFLTSKYIIPEMKKTGGGSIVNISSISALRPRGLTAYSASKGAVIALTKAMAIDHAEEKLLVH